LLILKIINGVIGQAYLILMIELLNKENGYLHRIMEVLFSEELVQKQVKTGNMDFKNKQTLH